MIRGSAVDGKDVPPVSVSIQRLGRNAEAALAYEAAISRVENATERDFLERDREQQ